MRIVGLVPAAGHATRLAGLIDGAKEVQPVAGRPVMTYLLERMRLAGAARIVVSTRPDKPDVIDLARRVGAEVTLGQPPTVTASLALAATNLAADDIALVGFPDSIWLPPDGFRPLVDLVAAADPIALGLFDSPAPSTGEVAIVDGDGRLCDLERRPTTPSSSWIWAIAVTRASALLALLDDGDDLGAALVRWTTDRPIATVRLGRIVDIGTPASLVAVDDDPVLDPIRRGHRRRPVR